MADDTRLAEACLLLNYSNQSYKEQMLLTRNLEESFANSQQSPVTLSKSCDVLPNDKREICISSPFPEDKGLIAETPVDCSQIEDCRLDISASQNNSTNSLNEGSYHKVQETIHRENQFAVRDPIQNLLAAVNCALPALKTRPNILQRYSNSSATSNLQSNVIDHDYCQQNTMHTSYNLDDQTANCENPCPSNAQVIEGDRFSSNQPTPLYKKKQKSSQSRSDAILGTKKSLKLVAVHLGAGNSTHESDSMQLAKAICEEVMLQTDNQNLAKGLRRKRKMHDNTNRQGDCCLVYSNNGSISAEDAVVQLIKRMEDHQALNCGFGSNLNILGQVECDASLMSDKTHMWAGVGALSGCKNPILLAKSLYDHRNIQRPLGLVQPNLLVGSGAKQWMREHCAHLSVMDSKMISQKSFSTYQKLKSRYDMAVRTSSQEKISTDIRKSPYMHDHAHERVLQSTEAKISDNKIYSKSTSLDHGFYCIATRDNLKRAPSFARAIDRVKKCEQISDHCTEEGAELPMIDPTRRLDDDIDLHYQDYRLDTVGAIAVDCDNNFASAISSGGLLLKYKGRVGQAAVPGAGCWSEDSVAVTTTGVGEYLTLNLFARKFYDKMLTLRLLYDLGHVEKKPDLSNLISCGMEECFEDLIRSPALDQVHPSSRLAGMLAVTTLNSKNSPKRIDERDLYLSYAHNTNSMCVGYMTCNDSVGHSLMSLRDLSEKDGEPLVKTMKFTLDS